jgi:ribosomal protein S18 acetylase RimI-like enzyme
MEQIFEIKKAGREAMPMLRGLAIKTFKDTFNPYNAAENMEEYCEKNFSLTQLEKEWHEAGTVFFLAFDGDEPIGYAKVRESNAPEALPGALEIERIYTRREYQGREVGKILLQACLHHARKAGYDAVWLGVWEQNLRAQAFYRKAGFERFGEHEFVLGDDVQTDWLMKKTI